MLSLPRIAMGNNRKNWPRPAGEGVVATARGGTEGIRMAGMVRMCCQYRRPNVRFRQHRFRLRYRSESLLSAHFDQNGIFSERLKGPRSSRSRRLS